MIRIALGGMGADSHTVGQFVLRTALDAAGFDVVDLGIQNDFGRFVAAAEFCDAVLISNMDGHAAHYLAHIRALPQTAAWYLGGNPSLNGDMLALERLGFRRIYAGFVSSETVIAALREDLPSPRAAPRQPLPSRAHPPMEIRTREAVLGQWATGREARDIEANAEILAGRPSLATIQAETQAPLLQPRSGVIGAYAQSALFESLLDAGAQVLSFQIDSLTRDGRYAAAGESLAAGRSLNGFPAVNHGPTAIRKIVADLPVPVQTRHSSRDARLLAEISYAGGVTAFEGGAICYNLPYYADLPIETSLTRWQYVDWLTGRYADLGVVLDREFFGTLTGTLVPPWLAIAIDILEAMLAVAQGVKSVSLAYAEQGCREQDVAALRVLRRLGKRFAGRGGTVQVATVFHQFMGAFPPNLDDAEALIEASATTAAMAGADRILTKAPCEARSIPDAAANARGLELVARGIRQRPPLDAGRVLEEEGLIEAAVLAVLDAVIMRKPGDLPGAIVAAFAEGVLDIPFSPSCHNAGRLWAARDPRGAIRVLTPGSVPLPAEVLRFDAACLAPRLRARGLTSADGWQLVSEDVLRTAHDRVTWPLEASAQEEGALRLSGAGH